MPEEPNKIIVRRFIEELWNERRLDVADEIFAADCVTHQLQSGAEIPTSPRNPKAVKTHVAEWLRGFPDLRFTAEQMFAEVDRVITQLLMKATHTGDWLGIAPTGKEITVRLIVIHRIENEKIVEDWVLVESLGFFQQLGLVPTTQEILANATK
jgi:predicted ester cyclase